MLLLLLSLLLLLLQMLNCGTNVCHALGVRRRFALFLQRSMYVERTSLASSESPSFTNFAIRPECLLQILSYPLSQISDFSPRTVDWFSDRLQLREPNPKAAVVYVVISYHVSPCGWHWWDLKQLQQGVACVRPTLGVSAHKRVRIGK
jgi:hypothetical protein